MSEPQKRQLPFPVENYRSKLRKTLLENFLVENKSSDLAEYYLENDKVPEFLEIVGDIFCTYNIVVGIFKRDLPDSVNRMVMDRTPERVICEVLVMHKDLVKKICKYFDYPVPRHVLYSYVRLRDFTTVMFLMTKMPVLDLGNISKDLFSQTEVLDWFVETFPNFIKTYSKKYIFCVTNAKTMKNWLRYVSVNSIYEDMPLLCHYLSPQNNEILDVILECKPTLGGSPFVHPNLYLESAKKVYDYGFSPTADSLYHLACQEKMDILLYLIKEKGSFGLFSKAKLIKFSFSTTWNIMCFLVENWSNKMLSDHKKVILGAEAQRIYSLLCHDITNEKEESRLTRSCPPTPTNTPIQILSDTERTLELLKLDSGKETHEIRIAELEVDFASKVKIYKQFKNESGSTNTGKNDAWVNGILSIPFGKKAQLPASLSDGHEKIMELLKNAKSQMDMAVFGHENAKTEIVDYIARLVSNPNGKGNVIGLCGEKGIGKTRLLKQGVSKTLGRPFFSINMGGMKDASILKGHSLTWHGSVYGLIADILIKSKVMNPVIYLDEVDKITSPEITNVLMHLLDPEQNSEFKDDYFNGINLDLSGVLFVLSLNDETKMDPILRDRVKMIYMNPLTSEDKKRILCDHIIPDLSQEIGIKVTYGDHIIDVLVSRYQDESGCRQLKKSVESILQKMNTQRIMTSGSPSVSEITLDDCKVDKRSMKEEFLNMYT